MTKHEEGKTVYEQEARAWRLGQRFGTACTQVHKNHFTAYGYRVIEQVDGMLYARVPELDKRPTRSLLKHLEAILQIQLKEEDGRYYKTEAGRQVELWPGFWYHVTDHRPHVLLATIESLQVAGVTPVRFKPRLFKKYIFVDREHWKRTHNILQERTMTEKYSLSSNIPLDLTISFEGVDREDLPGGCQRRAFGFGGYEWILHNRLKGVNYEF